jgi:hypothetical protein
MGDGSICISWLINFFIYLRPLLCLALLFC